MKKLLTILCLFSSFAYADSYSYSYSFQTTSANLDPMRLVERNRTMCLNGVCEVSWECGDFFNPRGVNAKAICNPDKTITFEKISFFALGKQRSLLELEDETHTTADAFCKKMGQGKATPNVYTDKTSDMSVILNNDGNFEGAATKEKEKLVVYKAITCEPASGIVLQPIFRQSVPSRLMVFRFDEKFENFDGSVSFKGPKLRDQGDVKYITDGARICELQGLKLVDTVKDKTFFEKDIAGIDERNKVAKEESSNTVVDYLTCR